ncbi:MAG: hypothetical protein ACHQW9_01305, partial [Nitrososphaerales archaeon]
MLLTASDELPFTMVAENDVDNSSNVDLGNLGVEVLEELGEVLEVEEVLVEMLGVVVVDVSGVVVVDVSGVVVVDVSGVVVVDVSGVV